MIVYGLPQRSDSRLLSRLSTPVTESIVRKSPIFASFVGAGGSEYVAVQYPGIPKVYDALSTSIATAVIGDAKTSVARVTIDVGNVTSTKVVISHGSLTLIAYVSTCN